MQNPLNNCYPETVYRTGDIVRYNEKGELMYVSRADSQIKHMGYRIELGEIESAASALGGVSSCAAVYDRSEQKIVLIYAGGKDREEIMPGLSERLPEYMLPQKVYKIKEMPLNQNGKIDRRLLAGSYKQVCAGIRRNGG